MKRPATSKPHKKGEAQKKKTGRLGQWILGIALLAAVTLPLTFKPRTGFDLNRGCAEGTCCPEYRSICNIGGDDHTNYYKKSEGSCHAVE